MKIEFFILTYPALKRLVLSIFFLSSICAAQLNTDNLLQLSEKDGLSSESVNAVIVDEKGYVWVGTPNGLSRYDGYGFKSFFSSPADSTAIQGMLIYALMEDHQNRIWAATNPHFLEVYDPVKNTFHSYNYSLVIDPLFGQNPLYGYNVGSIVENANHNIFFDVHSYSDAGWLLYLDPKDDKIKIYNNPDGKPFRDVYGMKKDPSGQVWLLSASGIYFIDENNVLTPFHSIDDALYKNNSWPTDLLFTSDNHLYVTTTQSVLIDFDRNTGSCDLSLMEDLKSSIGDQISYSQMILDSMENIWMGTNSGIYYFDRKTEVFSKFDRGEKKELENVYVSKLAIDHFGNLWIGGGNKGLLHYEKKPDFISYKSNSGDINTLNGWVGQILETSNGKIWLRNDNGLNILDIPKKEMELFSKQHMPKNNSFSTIWEKENDIYFAYFDGSIYKFSTTDQKIEKTDYFSLPEKLNIRCFKKDAQGYEWLGTNQGLYRKEKNRADLKHYDLKGLPGTDLRSNNINAIFESKKHGLWLQTDNGLFLYNYDLDTIERHIFQNHSGDKLITQDVNAFYEDPEGNAWIGLWQGGLVKYNVEEKKTTNYTLENGLPSMSIQGILHDEKNGSLWLSTFNGLSRFDTKTEKFNNFSVMDGIQGSQFSDGAYLKTSEGLFIFGGSNGITIFDPDEIKTGYDPPKVFLTDFKLFNKSVLPGEHSVLKKPIDQAEQILLEHDQNNISLQFIGLHYSNPLKNEYAYKLENYDDTWRNVGRQNEAFFPNLSPGKYIFKVKAANDKGVWSDETANLEITINPPWWRTWWAYVIYSIFLLLIGYTLHKFLKARTVRKERERTKDKELKQAKEIEKAYSELKSTQAQLIQSEKMASLGELTAGIAHEIQNPLNFVNNFSEVSKELIEELKEERTKLKEERDEILEGELLSDIQNNLDKINHHGQRASAIVKGMLQHSRSSEGKKEPTDINALCEEYLRLAYHGLRAKDKSFNADFRTDFDSDLPKIEVIPQDMGRVLLNLINNAFYAVNEKAGQNLQGYRPEVMVSTKKTQTGVEISVEDNGNGIAQNVVNKIFQPFFTTKPTGQGTGLGLSLSYDIIQAHGGKLEVETEEGQGSEFRISLPWLEKNEF